MSDEMRIFLPLYKVDEEKREVWGVATQEVRDADGEIMDYEKSLPHFMQWSQDANKRSGGKSNGNVREMHQPRAVGKVLKLIPDDTNKAIHVGVKVVDDNAWAKCKEGVYTGFSVGGRYGDRWLDKDAGGRVTRYEALPFEISLVDLPAVPTATFEMVKADGTREVRLFSSGGTGNTTVGGTANTSDVVFVQAKSPEVSQQPEWLGKFSDIVGKFSQSVTELSDLAKADKEEKDKILSELSSRGSSVGIARKDDEPLTPPKGYPSDWKLYGDPANWSWPCDEAGRCQSAVSYYNGGKGKEKYSPKEWAILGRRIARLATENGGAKYVYRPDDKQVERKEEKMNATGDMKKDFPQLLGDLRSTLGQAVDSLGSDPDATNRLLTQALAALDVADDATRANPSASNPTPPVTQAIESLKATGASMTTSNTATGPSTTPSLVPPTEVAIPSSIGTGVTAKADETAETMSSPSSSSSKEEDETTETTETTPTEKTPMTTPTTPATLSTAATPPTATQATDLASLKAEILKDLGGLIKDAIKEVVVDGQGKPVAKAAQVPLGDLNALIEAQKPDEALEILKAGGPNAYQKAVEKAGSEAELMRRASDAVVKKMVSGGVVTAQRYKVMNIG